MWPCALFPWTRFSPPNEMRYSLKGTNPVVSDGRGDGMRAKHHHKRRCVTICPIASQALCFVAFQMMEKIRGDADPLFPLVTNWKGLTSLYFLSLCCNEWTTGEKETQLCQSTSQDDSLCRMICPCLFIRWSSYPSYYPPSLLNFTSLSAREKIHSSLIPCIHLTMSFVILNGAFCCVVLLWMNKNVRSGIWEWIKEKKKREKKGKAGGKEEKVFYDGFMLNLLPAFSLSSGPVFLFFFTFCFTSST